MPTKRCAGGKGLKYGNSGKCYTGPSKVSKVNKQRKAIKSSQARSGKALIGY